MEAETLIQQIQFKWERSNLLDHSSRSFASLAIRFLDRVRQKWTETHCLQPAVFKGGKTKREVVWDAEAVDCTKETVGLITVKKDCLSHPGWLLPNIWLNIIFKQFLRNARLRNCSNMPLYSHSCLMVMCCVASLYLCVVCLHILCTNQNPGWKQGPLPYSKDFQIPP